MLAPDTNIYMFPVNFEETQNRIYKFKIKEHGQAFFETFYYINDKGLCSCWGYKTHGTCKHSVMVKKKQGDSLPIDKARQEISSFVTAFDRFFEDLKVYEKNFIKYGNAVVLAVVYAFQRRTTVKNPFPSSGTLRCFMPQTNFEIQMMINAKEEMELAEICPF